MIDSYEDMDRYLNTLPANVWRILLSRAEVMGYTGAAKYLLSISENHLSGWDIYDIADYLQDRGIRWDRKRAGRFLTTEETRGTVQYVRGASFGLYFFEPL
jgi:hypothetical protein